MQFVRFYLMALVVFFAFDLVWIGVVAKGLYQEQIGFLLKKEVNWVAAGLFYALYLFGLVYFAIWPAAKSRSFARAIFNGALFGLMCYAAYDLTNLATFKGWPVKITIYDMIWGTCLSGLTSWICVVIGAKWKFFS